MAKRKDLTKPGANNQNANNPQTNPGAVTSPEIEGELLPKKNEEVVETPNPTETNGSTDGDVGGDTGDNANVDANGDTEAESTGVQTTVITPPEDEGTDTDGGEDPSGADESDTPTESPFAKCLESVGDSATDKLHLDNLIESIEALLSIKKAAATDKTYEKCGQLLASLTRSLGLVSDHVFVSVFPVFLDLFEDASEAGGYMFTDANSAYKIFAHSTEQRALTKDHARFITAIAALAPSDTRTKYANSIDIALNFAVLPDTKRTRIKDIYR